MNAQLNALREAMKRQNVDMYLVMSDDFHQSEYVGDFFKARAYISKFSGSAGYILVTQNRAILWTDGRYFIQAAKELEGSGFELFKMGVAGVDTLDSYLKKNLSKNQVIGFDGRTVAASLGKKIAKIAKDNGAKMVVDIDLAGKIWTDRPAMSTQKVLK